MFQLDFGHWGCDRNLLSAYPHVITNVNLAQKIFINPKASPNDLRYHSRREHHPRRGYWQVISTSSVQAWTMFGSRENSKPVFRQAQQPKCSKTATIGRGGAVRCDQRPSQRSCAGTPHLPALSCVEASSRSPRTRSVTGYTLRWALFVLDPTHPNIIVSIIFLNEVL